MLAHGNTMMYIKPSVVVVATVSKNDNVQMVLSVRSHVWSLEQLCIEQISTNITTRSLLSDLISPRLSWPRDCLSANYVVRLPNAVSFNAVSSNPRRNPILTADRHEFTASIVAASYKMRTADRTTGKIGYVLGVNFRLGPGLGLGFWSHQHAHA